eukprot:TRINITY_DN4607_c0_g1_i4.p2 TRINITY_DN4607_c0_g1~~TRINITY_DN4607_c0_g1_i4.p2  ORF type:complete len:125 (+),score=24.70 TRINITY_DN4607_c0_g1_i4:178-552(+)
MVEIVRLRQQLAGAGGKREDVRRMQASRLAQFGAVVSLGSVVYLAWSAVVYPPRLAHKHNRVLQYTHFGLSELIVACIADLLLIPYVMVFSWLFGPPAAATTPSGVPLSVRFGPSDAADPCSTA